MTKLPYLTAVLVVLACLLVAPGGLLADGAEFTDSFRLGECTFKSRGANPYFILEPGYRLVLEGAEGKGLVRLEITVLNETRMVAGVRTRIVEEVETKDSQLVEISRNYFALCEQTNNVVYFGEEVDIYQDGEIISHDGAWKAGENGARAGLMMPGTVLLGARYFQEVAPDVAMDRAETISLEEVVETPAGRFEDCLVTEETTPLEPNAKGLKLYAPGIGLIQDSTLKLVWFSPNF